jgi:5'-nucleotidase
MSNRRSFLKNSTLVATATLFSKPISSFAHISKSAATLEASQKNIIIYHSSHINGYSKDLAGLNQMNKQQTGGLILDAGNFLGINQNTANHFAVISAMNTAGYHASMPSTQDLSYGEAYLAKLADTMNFSLINCNYIFNNSKLTEVVKPWQIIHFGKFKIGITGIGPEINGIGYQDPVKKANDAAHHLKNKLNCDLVVCLSGLDYQQKGSIADNITVAEKSEAIDFIISSNTMQPASQTMVLKNITGHDVFVGHSSAEGLTMGKMMFEFKEKQKHYAETRHLC